MRLTSIYALLLNVNFLDTKEQKSCIEKENEKDIWQSSFKHHENWLLKT